MKYLILIFALTTFAGRGLFASDDHSKICRHLSFVAFGIMKDARYSNSDSMEVCANVKKISSTEFELTYITTSSRFGSGYLIANKKYARLICRKLVRARNYEFTASKWFDGVEIEGMQSYSLKHVPARDNGYYIEKGYDDFVLNKEKSFETLTCTR